MPRLQIPFARNRGQTDIPSFLNSERPVSPGFCPVLSPGVDLFWRPSRPPSLGGRNDCDSLDTVAFAAESLRRSLGFFSR